MLNWSGVNNELNFRIIYWNRNFEIEQFKIDLKQKFSKEGNGFTVQRAWDTKCVGK